MKYTRITALAALSLATALSLTACGGTDAGANPSSAGSSPALPSSPTSPDGASKDDGSKPAAGGGIASLAGSGKGLARGKFCRVGDLNIEAVDSSPDKHTGDVTVMMTNKSDHTCSVTGFAGVDLKDRDGTSAPVARGTEQPRITHLKNGDTATFSISYPVDRSGKSLSHPTHLRVTPPNETHSVTLPWPAEALPLAGPYDGRIRVHPVGIAN